MRAEALSDQGRRAAVPEKVPILRSKPSQSQGEFDSTSMLRDVCDTIAVDVPAGQDTIAGLRSPRWDSSRPEFSSTRQACEGLSLTSAVDTKAAAMRETVPLALSQCASDAPASKALRRTFRPSQGEIAHMAEPMATEKPGEQDITRVADVAFILGEAVFFKSLSYRAKELTITKFIEGAECDRMVEEIVAGYNGRHPGVNLNAQRLLMKLYPTAFMHRADEIRMCQSKRLLSDQPLAIVIMAEEVIGNQAAQMMRRLARQSDDAVSSLSKPKPKPKTKPECKGEWQTTPLQQSQAAAAAAAPRMIADLTQSLASAVPPYEQELIGETVASLKQIGREILEMINNHSSDTAKHEAKINKMIEDHKADISQMVEDHKAEISQMVEDHKAKQEAKDKEQTAKNQKHEAKINKMIQDHKAEISQMVKDHKAEQETKDKEHEAKINKMIEDHKAEQEAKDCAIRKLIEKHTSKEAQLTTDLLDANERAQSAQSRLEVLQAEQEQLECSSKRPWTAKKRREPGIFAARSR
eukprot:m51a1_g4497 hypothetical protein (525) ;mRNA; r:342927-346214